MHSEMVKVPRELGLCLFLTAIVFTAISTMTLMTFRREAESERLRREILFLSERYVWALIREETGDVHRLAEGPVSGGRFSQQDMRRTIAVVLGDVLTRLDHLEAVALNSSWCKERLVPSAGNDDNT